ncbi:hypothetical protein [Aliikangiella maris]|uniref:ABC transporter substrate-binding protein n=2 Tax=Aliikangiella maris TaxID=3162458 RepID=A0ABV3MTW8_9GAMM
MLDFRQIKKHDVLRFFLKASVIVIFFLTKTATANHIFIAQTDDIGERGQKLTQQLKLESQKLTDLPIDVISAKSASFLKENGVIITIGRKAFLESIRGNGTTPIISVFVSPDEFEKIKPTKTERQVTAIFSEPDPLKQLALIKIILGENTKPVLVRSKDSSVTKRYKESAILLNVNLDIVETKDIDSYVDFINRTKESSTLILEKDRELFDKVSLDKILLGSYEINKQGVIGYSKGLVSKGGMATTYSTIENIAFSIISIFNKLESEKKLKEPAYTQKFKVAINKYILRSLDLKGRSEQEVQSNIELIIGGVR